MSFMYRIKCNRRVIISMLTFLACWVIHCAASEKDFLTSLALSPTCCLYVHARTKCKSSDKSLSKGKDES